MMFIKFDLLPDRKKKNKNVNNEILVNLDHVSTAYPCPTMKDKTEICLGTGLDEPYIILNHCWGEFLVMIDREDLLSNGDYL